MSQKNIILLTGLLGLLASLTVGVGEFLMHFSQQIVGNAENFKFFEFVPRQNLIWGHFIAIAGIPFYFVGYFHIYKMLEKGSRKLAGIVFGLGILAFTVGGFWITSRAFLGTIVHLNEQISPDVYQQILDNYSLLSESLVQVLRVIIFLLSGFFAYAILKTDTYYSKWMAVFNPAVLLLIVFAIYFISPAIGKYIAPQAMNTAHFALFGLSLFHFKKNF